MNLRSTAPDRYNRFSISGQWIRDLLQHLSVKPSILDIGSNESIMQEVLPECDVYHIDLAPADSGKFAQASILQLPFKDSSFDFTLCLDVLEHIHPAQRSRAIDEICRVSRLGTAISYPRQSPINTAIEATVNLIHQALFCIDHPFLQEHQENGLVSDSSTHAFLKVLGEHFSFTKKLETMDQTIWLLSQMLDYLVSQVPCSHRFQTSIHPMLNALSANIQDENNHYRTFIFGSQWDFQINNYTASVHHGHLTNQIHIAEMFQEIKAQNQSGTQYVKHLQTELQTSKSQCKSIEKTYNTAVEELEKKGKYIDHLTQTNSEKVDLIASLNTEIQRLHSRLSEQISAQNQLQQQHRSQSEEFLVQIEQKNNHIHSIEDYVQHLEHTIHDHQNSIIDLQAKITQLLSLPNNQDQ